MILTEYLPVIVSANVLDPLLDGFRNGKLPGPIDWENAPDMPVEFSAAAFRFGHSQVREDYLLQTASPAIKLFDSPSFGPVEPKFNVDFDLFFDRGGNTFQKARKIDTSITPSLLNLPTQVVPITPNLAARNMIRGQRTFLLPSGERIARQQFNANPIPLHPKVQAAGLTETPLWFYVLAEAEANDGKLGLVGGTIVAGTLLNLLLRDPSSIGFSSGNAALLTGAGMPKVKGSFSELAVK